MKDFPQGESDSAMRRKRRRSLSFFVAAIVVVLALIIGGIEALRRAGSNAGANASQQPSVAGHASDSFPRELRDAGGNLLSIKARPQRIASQTLGTDEVLLAICAPERIVAFSKFARDPKYSNVVAEANNLRAPSVQNAEDILQLRPDLIFVAS